MSSHASALLAMNMFGAPVTHGMAQQNMSQFPLPSSFESMQSSGYSRPYSAETSGSRMVCMANLRLPLNVMSFHRAGLRRRQVGPGIVAV